MTICLQQRMRRERERDKEKNNSRTAGTTQPNLQDCRVCCTVDRFCRGKYNLLPYGFTMKIPFSASVNNVVTNATSTGRINDLRRVSLIASQR